jgi:hypothetical protein
MAEYWFCYYENYAPLPIDGTFSFKSMLELRVYNPPPPPHPPTTITLLRAYVQSSSCIGWDITNYPENWFLNLFACSEFYFCDTITIHFFCATRELEKNHTAHIFLLLLAFLFLLQLCKNGLLLSFA